MMLNCKRCIFILALLLIVLFVQGSNGDLLPFSLPEGWNESNVQSIKKPLYEYSPQEKTVSQSSSTNWNVYNQLKTENIILTKELHPQTEFKKNEDILVKVTLINNKDDSIEKIILIEETPWGINSSNIVLEKGLMITVDKSNISISRPYLNYSIYNINDAPKNLNCSTDDASAFYLINSKYILIFIKKLGPSESIELKYNMSIANSKGYVLNPTKLYYWSFFSGKKIIESNPVYFTIVDSLPTISGIEINPNPAWRSNHGIRFKAVFEDKDPYDISRYELLSSVDGLLDNSSNISNQDFIASDCYNYRYINKNKTLSEGVHTITFKVFDNDGKYSESTMTLNIEDYFYIFPTRYFGWTLILAFILILIEILLKDVYSNCKLQKKYLLDCCKDNMLPLVLMVAVFVITIILPLYFLSYIFFR